MTFARKKSWDLHKNIKSERDFALRRVKSLPTSKRTTEEKVVASRSDCEREDREFIVDSGESLHMRSKNELTSGEHTPSEDQVNHHDRQRQGRVDGRGDSTRERLKRLFQNDAVGRFTTSAISDVLLRRHGLLL